MMQIRLANNDDMAAIVELIDGVLQEHGDRICLEGSEADLNNIAGNFFDAGGVFWVIADELSTTAESETDNAIQKSIHGTIALIPDLNDPSVCVLKRLYLAQELRGTEWSGVLMQTNIDWAREQGMQRIELWSDTRFERAHRFFAKFRFEKSGETRKMDDSHEVYHEHFFFLDL